MPNIIHYPNLKTVLEVENILKNAAKPINRTELKARLSKKIMHQTLNVILSYLAERGLIIDAHEGVSWIGKK